jgi:Calcineurin-like phosphoesterase
MPLSGRREFLKHVGSIGLGLASADLARSQTVKRGGARHLTILHTADIHGQLEIHHEFFYEDARPRFKRRGGFATLRTMIDALRRENPQGTLVVDGGDCFQGSAVAALSKGQAIIPLINRVRYDLVLPGNWEVVYGKAMLIEDMNAYTAAKVCANMVHSGTADASPIFPPYQIFERAASASVSWARTIRSRQSGSLPPTRAASRSRGPNAISPTTWACCAGRRVATWSSCSRTWGSRSCNSSAFLSADLRPARTASSGCASTRSVLCRRS